MLQKGHLAKVCRSKPKPKSTPETRPRRAPSQPVRRVGDDSEDDSDDSSQPVMTVRGPGNSLPPIKVHVVVDDCSMPMEVDTGASVRLISETLFRQLWPGRNVNGTTVRLQTYSKEPLVVVGSIEVQAAYQGQNATLPFSCFRWSGTYPSG